MHQYKNALQPLPIFRSRIFDSGPLRAGADASVRLHRGLQRAQVGRDHAAHHLRVRRRLPENLLNCAQCYETFFGRKSGKNLDVQLDFILLKTYSRRNL